MVLSFQAYPIARCALLEVQVPTDLMQPGQSVGSAVFDCFEAGLGAEVQIWSYTKPRYQKELNLTQQLPGESPQSPSSPVCGPSGHSPSFWTHHFQAGF